MKSVKRLRKQVDLITLYEDLIDTALVLDAMKHDRGSVTLEEYLRI